MYYYNTCTIYTIVYTCTILYFYICTCNYKLYKYIMFVYILGLQEEFEEHDKLLLIKDKLSESSVINYHYLIMMPYLIISLLDWYTTR